MDISRNVLQPSADSPTSGQSSSPNPEIDSAMTQLLFAARDLAHHQFSRRIDYPGSVRTEQIVCVECHTPQSDTSRLDHGPLCRTGRVLRVVAVLLALPNPDPERSASRKSLHGPADAAVEEQPRLLPARADSTFGEPWWLEESGQVLTNEGLMVVDAVGTELSIEQDLPYLRRIAACVNACAGIPTIRLEQALKGGVQ